MGLLFAKKREKIEKPEGGKWFKIVNTCAIIGLFIAVGLIVLMIMGTIGWSSAMVGITLAIAIICFCCILALPWIRKLEKGEFKILSYVFLGLVAFCCVLWVIGDIVIIKQYRAIKTSVNGGYETAEAEEKFVRGLLGALNYLKVTTFITIQFSVASFIIAVVIKLRKNMIVFQAIAYTSYAICDFWISGILMSIKIKSNVSLADGFELDKVFAVNSGFLSFLVSKVMITILVLAIAYVLVSNIIIKKQEQRQLKNATEGSFVDKEKNIDDVEPIAETPEVKLAKLKKMFENELITKEEYEAKKSDILKDL